MAFNYSTASTLYHGIQPGVNNAEKTSLDEIIASCEQDHQGAIEGRITYVSPVSEFHYANKTKGFVQNYFLTAILAKQSNHPIYTYRVTAWNDVVVEGTLSIDKYYRLSNFAWKETTYNGKIPEHQSKYEIHLKKSTTIEHIPI